MRKPIFLLTVSAFIVAAIATYVFTPHNTEETYLGHIHSSLSGITMDGPDKAVIRDVVMTMDPVTGEIPRKNVHDYFGQTTKARAEDAADFQWNQINSEIAGRVRSMMIDPQDPNKLWAGAVTGGLWYNPDFRNNEPWVPISDDWESLSISCITYDPNAPGTLYVGTGESYTSVNIYRESSSAGVGIYKSTDGGSTWTLLSSTSDFDYVNDIVVRNEDGTSVVYAGVASGTYQGQFFNSIPSDGLYRSTDGGGSWTQVLPNIQGSSVPYAVSDIEATANGEMYVGTMRNLQSLGGGELLHSSDGITWELENDTYVEDIVADGLNNYGLSMIPGRVKLVSGDSKVYAVATSGWTNNFNQIRDHPLFTRIMVQENNQWEYVDSPSDSWASIPWHALALELDPNNDDRLLAGGLNVHFVSDAVAAGELSWVELSDWVSMLYFSDYLIPFYGLGSVDSFQNLFVHADVHMLEIFGDFSDEFLAATDGGIQYSSDFFLAYNPVTDGRLPQYPTFGPINNSFNTTQYYTVALHPEAGNNEVLAGSQDNSTHTSENGDITYESMIGGGDGAYCFFDRDDPSVRITSSQSNAYNIWTGSTGAFYGFGSGTFINPADYDDRSNLLYTNMAVDGGFEALITSLQGRFLDTLGILNINHYINKDELSLDTLTLVRLGTGANVAFSAIKVSPYDDELDATLFLGDQVGNVYQVEGLPYAPVATKIDNDQLPSGYISSIDIGGSNNNLLVTFSNYGTESVWYTNNAGGTWQNIERNLPDVPVRHGIFNPLDDHKVMIATEVGVWGLENVLDGSEEWISYDQDFPNVRVDMIKARGADSVIVAATHGRGLFLGKFNQGEVITAPLAADDQFSSLEDLVYPNPTPGQLHFSFQKGTANLYTMDGAMVYSGRIEYNELDISNLTDGLYLVKAMDINGKEYSFKVVKE